MRIAIWHNLLSGGAKRALFYHTQGLVSLGHHVEVWCPPTADIEYLSLRPLARHHIVELDCKPRSRPRGLKGIYGYHDSLLATIKGLDAHCRTCATEINEGGFDILFANSSSILYNTPIGRYANIPSLIYLQEPYRWLYEALPKLPWLAPEENNRIFSLTSAKKSLQDHFSVYAQRIQAREELSNAKAYNRILVNSFYSRESVLKAYGLDSTVCELGIDAKLFQTESAEPKENYVVGLGGVYPLKRAELAIKALATISENARPPLKWIGNFSDETYKQSIVELARKSRVDLELLIGIDDSLLVKVLQKASVMIYTPKLEPFGFAPLEANACGTAVVGICEGGVRETVVNDVNGSLVNEACPYALGMEVLRYTSDPAYALRIGTQARKHVLEKWDLLSSQQKLEKLLIDTANRATS